MGHNIYNFAIPHNVFEKSPSYSTFNSSFQQTTQYFYFYPIYYFCSPWNLIKVLDYALQKINKKVLDSAFSRDSTVANSFQKI
jgi:hypothetical protein